VHVATDERIAMVTEAKCWSPGLACECCGPSHECDRTISGEYPATKPQTRVCMRFHLSCINPEIRTGAQVGVDGPQHGEGDAEAQQHGAPVVVLLLQVAARRQLLALALQLRDAAARLRCWHLRGLKLGLVLGLNVTIRGQGQDVEWCEQHV